MIPKEYVENIPDWLSPSFFPAYKHDFENCIWSGLYIKGKGLIYGLSMLELGKKKEL